MNVNKNLNECRHPQILHQDVHITEFYKSRKFDKSHESTKS